jgi:hypothetical protein
MMIKKPAIDFENDIETMEGSSEVRHTIGYPIELAAHDAKLTEGTSIGRQTEDPFEIIDRQDDPVTGVSARKFVTGETLTTWYYHGVTSNSVMKDQHMSESAIKHARELRDYYRSMFTMKNLQGMELTKWEQKLNGIVTRSDKQAYAANEIGLLSTLIQSYENNNERDYHIEKYGMQTNEFESSPPPRHQRVVARIVGANRSLGQMALTVFALADSGHLIQVDFGPNGLNEFFLQAMRNQSQPRFSFLTGHVVNCLHHSGNRWLKSSHPSSVSMV